MLLIIFKNLSKICVILKMLKKLPLAKVQVFGAFQGRLNQIITTSTSNRSKCTQNHFFSKTVDFCIFHLKIWSEKQLSRNTAYFLPTKMHIFRHKFFCLFFFCSGSEKLSLKSDQLEVSGSVQYFLRTVYGGALA